VVFPGIWEDETPLAFVWKKEKKKVGSQYQPFKERSSRKKQMSSAVRTFDCSLEGGKGKVRRKGGGALQKTRKGREKGRKDEKEQRSKTQKRKWGAEQNWGVIGEIINGTI